MIIIISKKFALIIYRYIKEFNKDLNYIYYDLFYFSHYIIKLKDLNIIEYIPQAKEYLYNIINNKNISKKFYNFINKLIFYFK